MVHRSTEKMFEVKLASDACYDKWRTRKNSLLNDKELELLNEHVSEAIELWDQFRKDGLRPDVIARASSALMRFASNIVPNESSAVSQEPLRNTLHFAKDLGDASGKASTSPSSVSNQTVDSSDIINAPPSLNAPPKMVYRSTALDFKNPSLIAFETSLNVEIILLTPL